MTQTRTKELNIDTPFPLPPFTVGALPPVSLGGLIYVINESGGPTPAFSDGAAWRRVYDLAVVS